ncbi:MAG: permease, partial [Candidatus Eremiobacteraeota bacterium]|nr:permease [Candidatus Eremiobacteraeota bacterium]
AMLRSELIIGYVIAGFASALVPAAWLSEALAFVGHIAVIGYPLLLLTGLGIAVLTFVCSMGNVPVARFLALAGIPLGANVTFIYGDLLVLPLIGIYRKSFAPKIVWAFLSLFVVGAMLAGAIMDLTIAHGFGGEMAMGSMQFNERFTLVTNIAGIVALLAVWLACRANASLNVAD